MSLLTIKEKDKEKEIQTATATLTHPIKKNIWESFERALVAKSKVFIRDIATRLSVPENVLIKEIFSPKNNIKAYLFDTCNDECFCTAFISLSDGKLAARCKAPVHAGTPYCMIHQFSRPSVQTCVDQELPIPKQLYRLQDRSDYPTLWFDNKGTVYDSSLKIRGYFNSTTKKLTLANINTL